MKNDIHHIPTPLIDQVFIDEHIVHINENQIRSPLMKTYIGKLLDDNASLSLNKISYEEIQQKHKDAKKSNYDSTKIADMQKIAKTLFSAASNQHATDIHIDVTASHTVVSMRIRRRISIVRDWEMTSSKGTALISAIYRLAQEGEADTDINIRANQDGRISNSDFLPPTVTSLRLARGPQDGGHFMVIRLLNDDVTMGGQSMPVRLHYLGYHESHVCGFEYTRMQPSGMVLIGGTTGSGKSTTLKHLLESLHQDKPHLCIMSVEEPAEYVINGVRQISVSGNENESERRKAFSDSIRLALRSDPDVILIGEIRDTESAHLAMRAAMTGHLVYATIHANNAFNVLTRIIDQLTTIETPRPEKIIADPSLLLGVAYQRLIETLCHHCKKGFKEFKNTLPRDLVERVETVTTTYDMDISIVGDGCDKCNMTGIGGVTVLSEFVLTDPELLNIVRIEGVPEARDHWIKRKSEEINEIRTIREHAIMKMKEGLIDPRHTENAVGYLTYDNNVFNASIKDVKDAVQMINKSAV
ncbi:MAG: ATPase, T2SS/T4P/T4SS family [Sedimenticola sp.]